MFALQLRARVGLELQNALALWPQTPLGGDVHFRVWQLVTYAFLHSTEKIQVLPLNLWFNYALFNPWDPHRPVYIWGLHILFNMLGLWTFGTQIEHHEGPWRLVSCYLASVVTAAVAQLIVPPLLHAPPAPTIGASGGVFGLLLVFALMFPRRKVIPLIPPIPMPAWVFAAIYGGLELYFGVTGALPEVAHFAHLGGMVGSFLVVMQWRWSRVRAR